MKKIYYIIFYTCIITLMFGSRVSFANIADFTNSKMFVDSNIYTCVASANKSLSGETYGSVKITEIYTSSGALSGYKYVWAKATTSSAEGVKVEKGFWTDVYIPAPYRATGTSVSLLLKGNKPNLDCMVKGYWDPY